jgi:hypothetical protein
MSIPLPIGLKIVQTARLGVFQAPQDRLVSQELGLNSATDGLFSAYRVKADGCWSVADLPDQSDAWFTFVYVLDGSLTLRLDDSSVTLQAHDAVAQVPLTDANILARSTRLEFLTIQVPDTARAHELLTFRSLPAISLDAPDTHVKGQGPRDYFDYRDLGLAQTTNRQIEVQIVRAQRARQGGRVMQEPGDALSIPAGCVHNAESFSDDYWALQLQIPPDYETTPAPSPE